MRLAGHTMGTPALAVEDAFRLFAKLGYDGVEIVWQDGYRSAVPEQADGTELRALRRNAEDLGLEICCLTPYMTGIGSLDDADRAAQISRFERCIAATAELGSERIRVYAGAITPGDPDRVRKRERVVDALQRLGRVAAASGVVLCVENHFNTFALTAAETVDLMRAVDSPGVGILYDQANLTFTHGEPWTQALPLQRDWIRHVQVKDLVFIDPDAPFVASKVEQVSESERTVRSRVVGEGILDWPAIISALAAAGYDGYLSVEYEYRWHPADLPEPEIGFRRSIEVLRPLVTRVTAPER